MAAAEPKLTSGTARLSFGDDLAGALPGAHGALLHAGVFCVTIRHAYLWTVGRTVTPGKKGGGWLIGPGGVAHSGPVARGACCRVTECGIVSVHPFRGMPV
jgi:hypothetical protein